MGMKIAFGILGAIVLVLIILGVWFNGTYNSLVQLDQATQAQWAQVQNTYQRRADLVPNLVATVKGAANFEQDTMTAVTEARAKVGQISSGAIENVARDPAAFQRFQQAQDGLSSALSRLLVVTENYPQLKATSNFRDLQAQLEGTENRITVERQRFNEAAQSFNTRRESWKTAEKAFVRMNMTATKERNAVLIFVVPARRKFVVLGDTGIHEKVGQDCWCDISRIVSEKFREGNFTDGLVDRIAAAGEQLATHFPFHAERDSNELPDDVDFGLPT